MNYEEMLAFLTEAIREGYHRQQELVHATDRVFEFLDLEGERLSEDEVLSLRVMLAQAETMIGRYFGS